MLKPELSAQGLPGSGSVELASEAVMHFFRLRPLNTPIICMGTAQRSLTGAHTADHSSSGHFSLEKESLPSAPPVPNPTDDTGKVVVRGLLKILKHSRKFQTAPRGVLKFIPTVG